LPETSLRGLDGASKGLGNDVWMFGLGGIAPAVDGVRLTRHVLAAAVWVGGQITMGGLVSVVKRFSPDAVRQVAQTFARMSWRAYLVLTGTRIWNVAATERGKPAAWTAILIAKISVVALAGIAAGAHGRARSRTALAAWGAVTGVSSVTALVMGVFLAG